MLRGVGMFCSSVAARACLSGTPCSCPGWGCGPLNDALGMAAWSKNAVEETALGTPGHCFVILLLGLAAAFERHVSNCSRVACNVVSEEQLPGAANAMSHCVRPPSDLCGGAREEDAGDVGFSSAFATLAAAAGLHRLRHKRDGSDGGLVSFPPILPFIQSRIPQHNVAVFQAKCHPSGVAGGHSAARDRVVNWHQRRTRDEGLVLIVYLGKAGM